MPETTTQHTDLGVSKQNTIIGGSDKTVPAEITQSSVKNAEGGSQSESSDTEDEQYKWKGGMSRAPLVNFVAGPKLKNRVDTRSKDYALKSSKKKATDSVSSTSSASSKTIGAEDPNTKESNNKKSGK